MACIDTQDGSPVGGAPSDVVLQGIMCSVVVAITAAGSTDTSVALLTAASVQIGSVTLADWVTRVNSATLGTTLTILQAGAYSCNAFMGVLAGQEGSLGLTLNATVAQRQGVTTMVDTQTGDVDFMINGDIEALTCSCVFVITNAMIAAGDNVIRMQYWVTTTGAPIPAGNFANVNDVVLRVSRVGEAA